MQGAADALLTWFYANRRVLPFRQDPSPYHIWVSEIMLQQTRMTAALPYYERFIAELPDPAALAACGPERLRKLWQGLGYYNRAANLQKAAQILCDRYGGALPADYDALRALPGIGDYTAGAIASIGFGIPAPAVDGNVLRVFARLYGDAADITRPETKKAFTRRVMAMQPPGAPGPFNEALMELGALICLPGGAPLCGQCPWQRLCAAHAAGAEQSLPVKPPKKVRAELPVTVALITGPAGVLLQKRPAGGLLAGLWQPLAFEGEALSAGALCARLAALGIPASAERCEALPPAKHLFTHKIWRLGGWRCAVPGCAAPAGCVWADEAALAGGYAVPSAFGAYLPAGPKI